MTVGVLKNLFERPNSILNQRNRNQFLATLLINLICIAHGVAIGWLSPTLRKLQAPDTPLDTPMNISEISWVGSALGIGAMIGNILIGSLLPRYGSKLCLLFIAIPHSCLWFLVYFAKTVHLLFIGRLLAGVCSGGMYIVHPIFLSEISDAKVRGTFGSMVLLSVNIGVLFGYIVGTHVSFYVIPFIALIFPFSYFIFTLLFIRDSPMHLIRRRKFAAAEKSFRYYKNIKDDDQVSILEFDEMKKKLTEDTKLTEEVTLKDFVTRDAFRAYGMALVVLIVNQFSGLFAMVNYMSDIFALSGINMNPDTCSIIIGVVQILGTYATTLLCDICGRRILLIVSSAGIVVSLTAFGFFTHYAASFDLSEYSWVPLFFMCMYIFLGNIGVVGCFFVVLVELYPVKIRARATSMTVVICSFFVFVMLNILPICMKDWGIAATMWSCAGVSAFGFVMFILFLKETKGKSMLED